jgi:hypothetical protein
METSQTVKLSCGVESKECIMRKLLTTLAAIGVLGLGAVSGAVAAPIAGFDAQYAAVSANCTLPNGTVPLCEAAINAYSGALVAANISIDEANASFTALRAEVFAVNAPNEPFQIEIDALFELLLPNSGAIGATPSPVIPG